MSEAPKIYIPKGDRFVDALTTGPIEPGTAVYSEAGEHLGYFSRVEDGGIVYCIFKSQAIKDAEAANYESTDWVNANEAPVPGRRVHVAPGQKRVHVSRVSLPSAEDFEREMEAAEFDPVDKPSHYAEGRRFEPIEVIEDWGLGMHLGNATKYISRAGRKGDELEDLKKARWYIDRRISLLEAEK